MKPTIHQVKDEVCRRAGLTRAEIESSLRRSTKLRQAAIFLARELCGKSLPQIARVFGGRDHTTILHACRRTEERLNGDPEIKGLVEQVRYFFGPDHVATQSISPASLTKPNGHLTPAFEEAGNAKT